MPWVFVWFLFRDLQCIFCTILLCGFHAITITMKAPETIQQGPFTKEEGFDGLPNELLDSVLEQLATQDLVAASRLDRRFHGAVEPFLYSTPLVCYSLFDTDTSNAHQECLDDQVQSSIHPENSSS